MHVRQPDAFITLAILFALFERIYFALQAQSHEELHISNMKRNRNSTH